MSDPNHEAAPTAMHPNLGAAARHGAGLEHPFSPVHPDPASHRAKFVLPARGEGEAAGDLGGNLPAPAYKVETSISIVCRS